MRAPAGRRTTSLPLRLLVIALAPAIATALVTPAAQARTGTKTKRPTISKVSPKSGKASGGTKVTITGSNFSKVTSVAFGKTKAKKFTVVSSKRITVTSPRHAAGKVDIRVTTKVATSAASTHDRFTFKASTAGILSFFAGKVLDPGDPTPGRALSSHLQRPNNVAVDAAGNVYIADPDAAVVEKVTPGGILSIYAGKVGDPDSPPFAAPGAATATSIGSPQSVAVDPSGNVYIGSDSALVFKVNTSGHLSLVAGNVDPPNGDTLTPGPATATAIGSVGGLAVDGSGDVFISDIDNNVIEKVENGTLSVVIGEVGQAGAPTVGSSSTRLDDPGGLALDASGNLYFADLGGNDGVFPGIFELAKGGTVSAITGHVEDAAPTPGPALDSAVSDPDQLAFDSAGNLYIADVSLASVVEKITPAGELSIVAGEVGFPVDVPKPGPANATRISPAGVAVDAAGDLYIADDVNGLVEKVTFPKPAS